MKRKSNGQARLSNIERAHTSLPKISSIQSSPRDNNKNKAPTVLFPFDNSSILKESTFGINSSYKKQFNKISQIHKNRLVFYFDMLEGKGQKVQRIQQTIQNLPKIKINYFHKKQKQKKYLNTTINDLDNSYVEWVQNKLLESTLLENE